MLPYIAYMDPMGTDSTSNHGSFLASSINVNLSCKKKKTHNMILPPTIMWVLFQKVATSGSLAVSQSGLLTTLRRVYGL